MTRSGDIVCFLYSLVSLYLLPIIAGILSRKDVGQSPIEAYLIRTKRIVLERN